MAQNVLLTHLGVRIRFKWIGMRRQVNYSAIQDFVQTHAVSDPSVLIVEKQMLPTDNSAYKGVVKVRNSIRRDWLKLSLPCMDYGVRLIRKEDNEKFQSIMQNHHKAFIEAVAALDAEWGNIKEEMRNKLGDLFREEDYIIVPSEVMRFYWEYVNMTLPDSLKEEVYKQELEKFREKADATLALIRLSFVEEFSNLVNNLMDRLSTDPNTGKVKRFKKATVDNLKEFLQRFKELNCTEDEQLTELLAKAEQVISGVSADMLREDVAVRDQVRAEFGKILDTVTDINHVIAADAARKVWM